MTRLRVAVVGSGPAGFYAAAHLLRQAEGPVEVDMLERLATPWGLVRGGVAPDHPKIKSVSRVYEKTARQPGFRFYGNVEVGRDVTPAELRDWYHAVVYAIGTPGHKRAGIPGEDLIGSWPATDFVGWYNAHPDYHELPIDLDTERAVVVGNGNVALDVARMLTLSHDELRRTDIADHALDVLEHAPIREVVVLGRRGPAQAAFTTPELIELGELEDVDVIVEPEGLELDPEDPELDSGAKRNIEVLARYAGREPGGHSKRIVLRFLASPTEILGAERVEGVRVVDNELVRGEDGSVRPRPTDREEVLPAGLVFRAIGYTGLPVDGLPFDDASGLIPNAGGRVLEGDGPLGGVYACGWVKRGPSGVIGTNKKCAQETVDALLEDLAEGRLELREVPAAEEVQRRLVEHRSDVVTYAGWEAIDKLERERGETQERPRVKLARHEELLEAGRVA